MIWRTLFPEPDDEWLPRSKGNFNLVSLLLPRKDSWDVGIGLDGLGVCLVPRLSSFAVSASSLAPLCLSFLFCRIREIIPGILETIEPDCTECSRKLVPIFGFQFCLQALTWLSLWPLTCRIGIIMSIRELVEVRVKWDNLHEKAGKLRCAMQSWDSIFKNFLNKPKRILQTRWWHVLRNLKCTGLGLSFEPSPVNWGCFLLVGQWLECKCKVCDSGGNWGGDD